MMPGQASYFTPGNQIRAGNLILELGCVIGEDYRTESWVMYHDLSPNQAPLEASVYSIM
jgi:hypothetical protein